MSVRWSDRGRFEELYRSTYPNVVAYCRRRLPLDECDDAVTEIYTVAWEKQDQFLYAEAPLAWLYAVGFRIVSGRYRATKRRRLLGDRLGREPQRRPATPEASVITDEGVQRVFDALADLKPRDQELLRLWVFEELSYDEIATVTGSSRASVRSALYHIRQRLRQRRDSQERDVR